MWNLIWDQFFGKFFRWLFGTDKTGTKVKVGQEKMAGRDQLTEEIPGEERYFELQNVNKKAKEKGEYTKAVRSALQAIPYLEEVEDTGSENVYWALEETSAYLPAIKEGEGELRRIKQKISSDPKIENEWIEKIDQAIEGAELMRQVIDFLKENPGLPQSKLWQEMDVDGRKWAPKLKYAERVGAIRTKRNKDIKLYAAGENSLKD